MISQTASRRLLLLVRWWAILLTAVTVVTMTAVAPAQAQGRGRVCMFNATEGAITAGHVGWAFRVGTADLWVFGATEDASFNWTAEGNWASVKQGFNTMINNNYYDHYRCKDTGGSSVTAAKNSRDEGFNRTYDVLVDNCLTRAVEIFKAYDSSLHNLPYPGGLGPNFYYDEYLYGFENRQYL